MHTYIAKLNNVQDEIIKETIEKLKDKGILLTGSKYEITKISLYMLVALFNFERVDEFRTGKKISNNNGHKNVTGEDVKEMANVLDNMLNQNEINVKDDEKNGKEGDN